MTENDGDGHSHRFKEVEGIQYGYLWCKLCKVWVYEAQKDENCPGMTKEDRKRIREREKRQKELSK